MHRRRGTGNPIVNSVSNRFGITHKTLRHQRVGKVGNPGNINLGMFRPRSDRQNEAMIVDQIQQMEKSLFVLTTVDVRRLEYDFATKLGIVHSFSHDSTIAGENWLAEFSSCIPELSTRKPKSTSMARVVGFNRAQVASFYDA